MKLRTISMMVLAVALSVVMMLVSHNVVAGESNGCSKATLQGSFGFYRTGFTQDGPLAAIGTVTYDGKGKSIIKQTISRNGVFEFEKSNNTYIVNPDCTGKEFLDGVEINRFDVINGGNGLHAISRLPGDSIFLVAKKMHPSTAAGSTAICSNASLQGSYGFYRTGFTPDGPLAAIGVITYDGKGNNHGRQTISRNGVFEFVGFEGTYEVNSDCTVDTGAIVVDEGNELYNLSINNGNAVYVVSRKIQ